MANIWSQKCAVRKVKAIANEILVKENFELKFEEFFLNPIKIKEFIILSKKRVLL